MSTSITFCPQCKTLILSDTPQCPSCHHVLDDQRAVANARVDAHRFDGSADERSCPDCDARVRVGLVRCWNCGGFMQERIGQLYRDMQDREVQPLVSDPSTLTFDVEGFTTEPAPAPADEYEQETPPDVDGELVLDMSFVDLGGGQGSDGEEFVDDLELPEGMELSDDNDLEFDTGFELFDDGDSYALDADIPAAEWAEDGADTEFAALDEEQAVEAADEQTDAAAAEGDAGEETGDHEIDALIGIAMAEESEQQSLKRRRIKVARQRQAVVRKVLPNAALLVQPPCRCCLVKVEPWQYGKLIGCPKCNVRFEAPRPKLARKARQEDAEAAPELTLALRRDTAAIVAAPGATVCPFWIEGARLAEYDPAKIKTKPDALAKSVRTVDIGLGSDGLYLTIFGRKPQVPVADPRVLTRFREAARAHLETGRALGKADEVTVIMLNFTDLLRVRDLAPLPPGGKDLPFKGIPVFGSGAIALALNKSTTTAFPATALVLTLSQWRAMRRQVTVGYGYRKFSTTVTAPVRVELRDQQCKLQGGVFRSLEASEFYLADERLPTDIVGWQCKRCSGAISEAKRAEKKLGGKSVKAMANVKCPGCSAPMSAIPLYGLVIPAATARDKPATAVLG